MATALMWLSTSPFEPGEHIVIRTLPGATQTLRSVIPTRPSRRAPTKPFEGDSFPGPRSLDRRRTFPMFEA